MNRPLPHIVQEALNRAAALADQFGPELLLLALAIGAIVQFLSLFTFRIVGTVLGLSSRALAWALGVLVALAILESHASGVRAANPPWPEFTFELIRRWLDRSLG